MISHTEENYLKALFAITWQKGSASVNEISKHLDIKMPTVNSMMKRLAEKGLVKYESYKPLRLTEAGKKQAALIIRKHRLTEMYLVEKMGFGWADVHAIAEQIEHIQSEAFFQKMDEQLGFPTVDPHGSPIPDSEGNFVPNSYLPLTSCEPGDMVQFMAVQSSSEDLLRFLSSKQLSLGTKMDVLAIEKFDHSVSIRYGKQETLTLSCLVAQNLLVKPC